MKTNTKYKTIFVLIITLFLGAALSIGLLYIRQKIVIVKEMSIRSEKSKGLDFGAQLRGQVNLLDIQEDQIKGSFILSSEVLNFIQTLELLALDTGLKITIEKVEEGDIEIFTEGVSLESTVFSIQVQGNYSDTVTFVDILSRSEKKLLIDQVNMYRSENEESVSYSTRMKLTALVLSYE